MITKVDAADGYVISSHGMWLPGLYDSERTARYAFRFPDATLQRLQDEINHYQRQDRSITMADLRAARQSDKSPTPES
jgi:hypothetical protein